MNRPNGQRRREHRHRSLLVPRRAAGRGKALRPLILLRHSFCLTFCSGVRPQQGHRGRTSTSVRARRIRSVVMEFGMWRCDRSGRSSGSVTGGNGRLRASPGAGRSSRGNKLLFGDQEFVGCDAESCVMVKATPAATLTAAEADLLLEFEIITLNPPTQFSPDRPRSSERRCRPAAWRTSSDPVRRRPPATRSAATPLLLARSVWRRQDTCRTNPPAGEPRGQWRVAAVAPCNLSPGIGGKLDSQGLAETGRCVSSRRNRVPGRPRPDLGAGGNGASLGPLDHRGGPDAGRVSQRKFTDPSTQFAVIAIGRVHQRHARRHAVCHGLAQYCCKAISGLVWKRMSSGTPAIARRAGSSAQSFGEDTAGRQRAGCPGAWLPIRSHRHLAVVLLAQLAATLPRRTDRVAAFLRKAGVIDDPGLDRFIAGDRR